MQEAQNNGFKSLEYAFEAEFYYWTRWHGFLFEGDVCYTELGEEVVFNPLIHKEA